jgi:hypothetical protein
VYRATRRARQSPDNNLNKHPDIQHVPFVDEKLGFHVGERNNMTFVLSIAPTTSEFQSEPTPVDAGP